MKIRTQKEVAIFDGLDSLHAFINDRLIHLRNSDRCRNVNLCHGDKQTTRATKKFLHANGFKMVKNERSLEIKFPNSTKQSSTQHVFFVNTQYEQSEISGFTDQLLNEKSKSFTELFIYLLNSDSYFGYYNQYKKNRNASFIGSPASPANMENWNERPF